MAYNYASLTFTSIAGNKKPHFGELRFHEDVHKLELRSTAEEDETHEKEKIKKIINLKGNYNNNY